MSNSTTDYSDEQARCGVPDCELTREQAIDIVEALTFYANPETYFAIGFLPDRPCGEFADDVSDTGEPYGWRPGAKAREAIGKLRDELGLEPNGWSADG